MDEKFAALSRDVIQAFDDLSGVHPGYRPAHAKGILVTGEFIPSPDGAALTRAPHLHRPSTPVTVRFSDAGGIPAIPDNDPNASPRGMAIRFHLAEHVHTDIISHSVDGFPVRTAEELLEFLHAVRASGADAGKATPIEKFLQAHPAALAFVQAPKPIPLSFAKASFFGVNAYKFTNADGLSHFGRYRIRPRDGGAYLTMRPPEAQSPNFLFDEIKERITKGPATVHIAVQLAAPGDVVDDSTVHWPDDRPESTFGVLHLKAIAQDNDEEQRRIIFDPVPRVDGIDPSGDPLIEAAPTSI